VKKVVLSTLTALALAGGISGCVGEEKASSSHSKETALHKQFDPAKRMAELDAFMQSWSKYGFDVNKTAEAHYLLTIKDGKKAGDTLIHLLGFETLDKEERSAIYKEVEGLRFDVKADKEKFIHAEPESIYVAFLGKDKSYKAMLGQLIKEKKLGAYFTLDEKNRLKQIRFRELDEHYSENNETMHLVFKDTFADIRNFSIEHPEHSDYTFKSALLKADGHDENNGTAAVGYEKVECDVKRTGILLGTANCMLDRFFVNNRLNDTKKALDLTIRKIGFSSDAKEHNGKIDGFTGFSIANIDIKGEDKDLKTSDFNVSLDNFKIETTFKDLNATLLNEFAQLQSKPITDENTYLKSLFEITGKLYSRLSADMHYGFDRLSFNINETSVDVKKFSGKGDLNISDVIKYDELDNIASINAIRKTGGKSQPIFMLQNFRFGYGIEKLYNFIPELSSVVLQGVQAEANASAHPNFSIDKALGKVGEKIINEGFGIYIDPLGWDTFESVKDGKPVKLGKMIFKVHTRLDANNAPVDLNNPLAMFMLLNLFHADGKLVLKQKDLQIIASVLPPQAGMMLIMFAKQQGDNVVYEIKFKNGMLRINGQPLM
jgi:hypothetical protein